MKLGMTDSPIAWWVECLDSSIWYGPFHERKSAESFIEARNLSNSKMVRLEKWEVTPSQTIQEIVMDQVSGLEIYDRLKAISESILTKLGMQTEPHKPVSRTRPFKEKATGRLIELGWKNIPKGILYHYTGGPSGLKSMRWCNDPSWGNTGSSWHVTVFDRIVDNIIGEMWSKVDPDIRRLFPVPVIINADWRWGTWHGNWTNDVMLGVENRNTGYSGWKKVDKNLGIEKLGKSPHFAGDRKWEPYTREQMVCNINLGRLANAIFSLDRTYVMQHQAIWATKSDTGLAFPMKVLRHSIFSDLPIKELKWLGKFEMAPDTNEDDDVWWEAFNEFRDDLEYVAWESPAEDSKEVDLELVAAKLALIGYDLDPYPGDAIVRKFVRWFQRSTAAYKYHESFPNGWVLKCDGIAGPATDAALDRRLSQLKLL